VNSATAADGRSRTTNADWLEPAFAQMARVLGALAQCSGLSYRCQLRFKLVTQSGNHERPFAAGRIIDPIAFYTGG
jgi:hypothetical protein